MVGRFEPYASLALRISCCSRDLYLEVAFGCIARRAPARSSPLAASRNSCSAFSISPALTASRTFLICERTADLMARFRSRRTVF